MANHTPIVERELQELDMQELEAVQAPGWATSIGVSVGITIVSIAASLT
ncbi:daptide-type RiPP [Streptomyces incanus]|uniref:Daptide-type RiPP n=1 Tax=Streptomyces incanus TaxID=887453 RepID=A0ABW0Y161_9ACTN